MSVWQLGLTDAFVRCIILTYQLTNERGTVMFRKSLKAIAVTAVFCFTAIFSCVTASANSEEIYKSLEQLEWGMTLEETEAIMGTPDEKEEEFLSDSGQIQTLLTYNGVDYMGCDGYIILCYTEENGFEAVNFHVSTDNSRELYAKILDKMKDECTEYEYDGEDDIISLFHFDNDNCTVFLFDLFYEVQVSYFPLFDEGCRDNPLKGGGAADVHEEFPETGNTSVAMLVCIMTASGIAAVLAGRKSNKS